MAEISPVEWLGIALATRNKLEQERIAAKEAEERNLVNQRLTEYGGDIGQYQTEWERGYGPQKAASTAQAKALENYWSGLPAALLTAEKETQGSGESGGGIASVPRVDPAQMLRDYIARQKDIAQAWDSGVARAYEGQRLQPPTSPRRPTRPVGAPKARVVKF